MGLTIPFHLRGYDGLVTVEPEVNRDPRRWGYHLLGLPYDAVVAEGFPVVQASVRFPGEGYAAAMGWVQVIRYGSGPGDGAVAVDQPPQHQEAATPYYCWGTNPTFFDAPSTTRRGIAWRAEAFLATSPDALMTRTVEPLCGFRWGYTTRQATPEILPVEPIGDEAWRVVISTLRERYPGWKFLDWRDGRGEG
jgi:hypothetical protein